MNLLNCSTDKSIQFCNLNLSLNLSIGSRSLASTCLLCIQDTGTAVVCHVFRVGLLCSMFNVCLKVHVQYVLSSSPCKSFGCTTDTKRQGPSATRLPCIEYLSSSHCIALLYGRSTKLAPSVDHRLRLGSWIWHIWPLF